MVVRSLSCRYEYEGVDSGFDDVPRDNWAAPYITFAKKNGWIDGYDATHFAPNAPITRAEVAKILATAIRLNAPKHTSDSDEFSPYIRALRSAKIFSDTTDLDGTISREDVSELIYKTFLGGR
jgi:S-layer homology domain